MLHNQNHKNKVKMIIKQGDDSGKITKIVDPSEDDKEKLRIALEKKEKLGNKNESDHNGKLLN